MGAVESAVVRRAAGPRIDLPEGTIPELFFEALRHDKADAWKVRREGVWHSLSHRRIEREVRRLALGLRDLGLRRGDRVAILSENRPEWHFADYACVVSGFVSVPVYPTLPAEQIEYTIQDSGARVIFASTPGQLEKVKTLRRTCPTLEHAIAFDPPGRTDDFVRSLASVCERGDAEIAAGRDAGYRDEALSADPHDLLTILYTSGTTGRPKGVMLTHNNLFSNVRATLSVLPVGSDDSALSFLPLSHVFERMVAYAFFTAGVTVAYCESHELLRDHLPEVRPTVMTAVPRVYEKVYRAVHDQAQAGSALRRNIFFWARRVAAEWAERRLAGRRVGVGLAARRAIADRLVYRKVRARTGGRIRFFISGGAPLDPELGKFFYGFGLQILEGYGLTETSPVIAANLPERFKFGTVGRPIPGVEVAIAADGEILTRGPHVMKGYYRKPEETASVIDAEGWFHTGDIGEVDEDDFLRITDRKKDLIVTGGGKNIAPQPIEERVKRNKYVAEAVMIGDRRPYPILLVVPNFDRLAAWRRRQAAAGGPPRGAAAPEAADRRALVADPEVVAFMEQQVLEPLGDLASFERPKKMALLADEFTIESGELTPTIKVKRRVIEQRYREVIERVYGA